MHNNNRGARKVSDKVLFGLLVFTLGVCVLLAIKNKELERKERDAEIQQWIKHEIFLYDIDREYPVEK